INKRDQQRFCCSFRRTKRRRDCRKSHQRSHCVRLAWSTMYRPEHALASLEPKRREWTRKRRGRGRGTGEGKRRRREMRERVVDKGGYHMQSPAVHDTNSQSSLRIKHNIQRKPAEWGNTRDCIRWVRKSWRKIPCNSHTRWRGFTKPTNTPTRAM